MYIKLNINNVFPSGFADLCVLSVEPCLVSVCCGNYVLAAVATAESLVGGCCLKHRGYLLPGSFVRGTLPGGYSQR